VLLAAGVLVLAVSLLLTASRGGPLSVLAGIVVMVGRREHAIEQNRLVLARQPSHEAAHRAPRSVGMAVLDAAPRP
jgi:hypothetical protein